ncbi:MAG TPA: GIY-YIG nuclease family protein [Polyangiaceae bacterium]|nr:GIY-YIG nuclease family protein [Polyangiaceae bacterium]
MYLLLGDDDTASGGVAIYVGEGDWVIDRIVRHDSTRDFWHTVVLFTSKDDNLNKAHARWLEARLVETAKQAVRARVSGPAHWRYRITPPYVTRHRRRSTVQSLWTP